MVGENVLLKPTAKTRAKSFQVLRELYGLDRRILLFRALRDLWDDDADAQPLLAVLEACARDPILRATAEMVLATPEGAGVTPEQLGEAIKERLPGRYNVTTLFASGQHAASSWQQAGHLQGRLRKVRARAVSRPAAVAYALLLGYLDGGQGDALFHTLWARLLDAPEHELRSQAVAAARQGWLEYRAAGRVTELSFRYLLREEGAPAEHE